MKKKEIKEDVIISYLPLVKMVASRLFSHLPPHVDFDDLIGYGVLGLIEAFQNFVPGKKTKFSTYAFYRIKGAMLDGLRSLDWLPRSLRHKIRCLQAGTEELKNRLGREPHEDELAKHLDMDISEVRSLLFTAQQSEIISLEEVLQDSISLGTTLGSTTSSDIAEEELIGILTKEIEHLGEKERLILKLYYYEGLNLKEIGSVLGLSESRVSQLLSENIRRLRQRLEYLRNEVRL